MKTILKSQIHIIQPYDLIELGVYVCVYIHTPKFSNISIHYQDILTTTFYHPNLKTISKLLRSQGYLRNFKMKLFSYFGSYFLDFYLFSRYLIYKLFFFYLKNLNGELIC